MISVACNDQALLPTATSTDILLANAKVSDPTATWKIPLNATGLAFQSDGAQGSGGNSLYADGVCQVSTTIFYTGSGDATIQTSGPKGRNCGRAFKYVYPDGTSETVATYPGLLNLSMIETTTFNIPVGTTKLRHMNMGAGTARCGAIHFGLGQEGNGGVSDSLQVTRVDSKTWHVTAQPFPHDSAMCQNTGEYLHFPVDFTIVSSAALP